MVIDCDIRSAVPGVHVLRPYLDAHWRDVIDVAAFATADEAASLLPDADGRDQTTLGTTVADVVSGAIERLGASQAVVWPRFVPGNVRNPDIAGALTTAVNDWQAAEWLSADERLRGGIVVDPKQPTAAAKEIDRAARLGRFAQVMLPIRSEMLYGNREMWPIYEAAARHGLPVALHVGGRGQTAPTSSGYPSYDVEVYVGMSQILESHIMSLIAEGVFDRFGDLRVVAVGAGWAWLPAWMWRMDKEWKGLQREIPWVREAPPVYMRRHLRFTLHPVEVPDDDAFRRIVAHMASDEMIVFGSGYPEARPARVDAILSPDLPDDLRRRVLQENAASLYGAR